MMDIVSCKNRLDCFAFAEGTPVLDFHNLKKLPNLITLSRIIATIITGALLGLINRQVFLPDTQLALYGIVLVLCLYISLSDFFDGYFARRNGECTAIGEKLDPIADKIFAIWILYALEVPAWLILVMITRDLIVTLLFRGGGMKTSTFAKWKTAFLYCAVFITVGMKIISPEINLWAWESWRQITLTHITLLLTVSTLLHYLWRAWQHERF